MSDDLRRILFIGDVFGQPGRRALCRLLPRLIEEHTIDFVVVNAENAAGGFGLTPDIARELLDAGADVLTGGNHTWDKPEICSLLEDSERVLRPHNFPATNPGSGVAVIEKDGTRYAVLNLQGRVHMPQLIDCPFAAADRVLADIAGQYDVVVADLHAEATSEKIAMAWFLDGRVHALVGTHTHVQTADEQVFPGGLGYITDLGMTGPHQSIIGVEVAQSLARFRFGRSSRFEAAKGDVRLHGAVATVRSGAPKALNMQRIQVRFAEK